MTVSSETNRWDYTGNGVLLTYPFTAEIYVKTDLLVYVSGVLKTVDVDYTIEAASIENPAGGNVVFTTAPALSAPIAIILCLPMTQLVDYVEGDKFPAETHERALDRLVKLIQYIRGKFSHVAKLGDDSAIELVMPNPTANHYIGWNAAGTNLENKTNAPIVTTESQYEIDALVTYGASVNYTKATIDAALTAIGIVNKVTLLLRPGTWTITDNSDYSTYTNVNFKMPNGATFALTALKTLTLPSPANILAASNQQIFSGAGTASFSAPGTVYPEWWGVDGTSDETEINKAFASLSKGGIVDCTADTYSIDGTITPINDTTMRINPWTTITLAATTDCPMITIAGKTNIRITGGGVLDAAKSTQAGDTDDHVLSITTASSYITVEDVTMTNSYDDTVNSAGTSHLTIKNCRITNSRNNGIVLTGDSKVSITDNYFYGNVAVTGTANIVPYTGCTDVLIARNRMYDTGEVAGQGHGVYIFMSQGIRIHDNYFEDMFGMGIEVNTQTVGTVVMITGNIMHQCGNVAAEAGGIWIGAAASAVVANNAVTEAQYHGIYAYQSDRCTIANNIVLDTKNTGYGLRLLDATNTSLVGNAVGDTAVAPTSAASISVGSVGVGPLSIAAVGNVMAGSTLNYIANKEKGIQAAANYETLTAWQLGNTFDSMAGQVKTLTGAYTLVPGYSGVYILDPGGAHRNIICDTGFRQGTVVVIVNTADAAENLIFDSGSLAQAVGQNERGIFTYSGTAWIKIFVG